jgi:hypothetical protein
MDAQGSQGSEASKAMGGISKKPPRSYSGEGFLYRDFHAEAQ